MNGLKMEVRIGVFASKLDTGTNRRTVSEHTRLFAKRSTKAIVFML